MTRLGVRIALAVAGLAAMAAAALFIWSAESRSRSAGQVQRATGNSARQALADASDLRAAQQAYVAVGQGQEFWFARVAALSKDLDEVLAVFKERLTSADALAEADTAAAAAQDFRQVDRRAREFTAARQLSQASDVIFADGFEVTQKIADGIGRAMVSEAVARDAARAGVRRQEALALAAAAAGAAFALLLLVPRATRAAPPKTIADLPKPIAPPSSRPAATDLSGTGVVSRAATAKPSGPAVDLGAMAGVCADIARVSDTRAVPALLERAAAVLDAAGIVLWVADPDGRELTPIVTCGYPPEMVSRLGTIARDAANVTASAYRTGLLQTVRKDKVSDGAIAAPLVSAGGCVGVMAAEMRNGGEQREPLLAAATIIASQLSTLVGPPAARARSEATG